MNTTNVITFVALVWSPLFVPTYMGMIFSNKSIINTIKNEYILSDSKNFYKFSFFYLYNYLNCTLTEYTFQFRTEENFHEEIYHLKMELQQLKKQPNDKNLWFFWEFNLFDSITEAIEDIELLMRNYGTSFMEAFNEFQLSSTDLGYVSKKQMPLCEKPMFDAAITCMNLTASMFILERVDISEEDFVDEFSDMLQKTMHFFDFVFSLLNEYNVDLLNANQKEIYLFLKVTEEEFLLSTTDEDMKISLYDSIFLKNKYGRLLTDTLFKLFDRIFFFELEDVKNYYDFIEIHLIYINTKQGIYNSAEFSREHPFFALTQEWKKLIKINEGLIMIRIPNQFRINRDTKHSSYFDSDIIYKSIMETVNASSSSFSSLKIKFTSLYSQKSRIKIEAQRTYKDNNVSLIVMLNANYDEVNLIDHFLKVLVSNAFFNNDNKSKKRFQVIGSCYYAGEGVQPQYQNFFSHGLNTYTLYKITNMLTPGKKLLHISILAAADNNQIKAREVAEWIINNAGDVFLPVLIYEKDTTEKVETLKSKEQCGSCLVGYAGLYALYMCIFVPIILTTLICIFLCRRFKNAKKYNENITTNAASLKMKYLEPEIKIAA